MQCVICDAEYTPVKVRKNLKYCSTRCHNKGTHQARKERGPRAVTTSCAVEGCARPSKYEGAEWCGMHYRRLQKHGELGGADALQSSRYEQLLCSVDGCERKNYAARLCSMHYNRQRTTGEVGEAATATAFAMTTELKTSNCGLSHSWPDSEWKTSSRSL